MQAKELELWSLGLLQSYFKQTDEKTVCVDVYTNLIRSKKHLENKMRSFQIAPNSSEKSFI